MQRQSKFLIRKIPAIPKFDRARGWTSLRNEWIASHSTCACCGIDTQLAVHHVKPLHLFPELELDDTNLITLCQRPERFCHYIFGHFFDWMAYNPDIKRFAPLMLKRIQNKKYQ